MLLNNEGDFAAQTMFCATTRLLSNVHKGVEKLKLSSATLSSAIALHATHCCVKHVVYLRSGPQIQAAQSGPSSNAENASHPCMTGGWWHLLPLEYSRLLPKA